MGGGFGRTFFDRRHEWRDVILPANGKATTVYNSGVQSMSYLIKGLDPGQNYEAKVESRNKFGWSSPSEPFSFQTTDNGELSHSTLSLRDNTRASFHFSLGNFLFARAHV